MVKVTFLIFLGGCAQLEFDEDPDGPNPGSLLVCTAYDQARGQMVVFGGGITRYPTTWGWNGESWEKLAVGGPQRRTGCYMAYDASRQKIVMFGGVDADPDKYGPNDDSVPILEDTWLWDGANWVEHHGPQPPSLKIAMAYDSDRRRILFYGGIEPRQVTWVFDQAGWRHLITP